MKLLKNPVEQMLYIVLAFLFILGGVGSVVAIKAFNNSSKQSDNLKTILNNQNVNARVRDDKLTEIRLEMECLFSFYGRLNRNALTVDYQQGVISVSGDKVTYTSGKCNIRDHSGHIVQFTSQPAPTVQKATSQNSTQNKQENKPPETQPETPKGLVGRTANSVSNFVKSAINRVRSIL